VGDDAAKKCDKLANHYLCSKSQKTQMAEINIIAPVMMTV
jgi:hypothetical protein